VLKSWDRRGHELARRILTVSCEETHGSRLENPRVKRSGGSKCGVSEVSRSHETRSKAGPLDLGRHVAETREFEESCFGRTHRRRL
jgi:hypothetical protein